MRVVIFCHSLISDWNHGNAHFLRGVASELQARGHVVRVHEPRDAWSVRNLRATHGAAAIRAFGRAYRGLSSLQFDPRTFDVAEALDGADLVMVHEWNDPGLIADIGRVRARSPRMRLLFHDTHHRAVTAPQRLAALDLRDYDGVLAFGDVIRELYLARGWTQRAWTWHEAADVRMFRPLPRSAQQADLVWIGNWGDDERSAELREYFIEPVGALGLSATVHGVRYPDDARALLAAANIEYRGWLPNFEVPAAFARHRVTIHVPRRPYAHGLPGIPTIRPFEALACGIPLVSAPWDDVEGLFRPDVDYLVANDGAAMTRHLRAVLEDEALAASLARNGRDRILDRHTCAHRVDELLDVYAQITPARHTMLAS
jgi:spore maturation protein CgeB